MERALRLVTQLAVTRVITQEFGVLPIPRFPEELTYNALFRVRSVGAVTLLIPVSASAADALLRATEVVPM